MKYLIACPGHSLTKGDIDYASSKVDRTIAVNGAIHLCSTDSICYSSDPKWYRETLPAGYREQLCPFDTGGTADTIPFERGTGFKSSVLRLGHSSGFAAVHLALLRGAKEIYLLGYDMGKNKKNSKAHYFGEYPQSLHKESPYEKFIQDFEESAKDLEFFGATIVNCTPDSNLNTFIKTTIKEAL